jgi:hypothetical protein
MSPAVNFTAARALIAFSHSYGSPFLIKLGLVYDICFHHPGFPFPVSPYKNKIFILSFQVSYYLADFADKELCCCTCKNMYNIIFLNQNRFFTL